MLTIACSKEVPKCEGPPQQTDLIMQPAVAGTQDRVTRKRAVAACPAPAPCAAQQIANNRVSRSLRHSSSAARRGRRVISIIHARLE